MATITPSVAPGSYLDHQTIKFNFSAGVMETALTKGNIPPSISKYIAYDTLSPPNPFIAVTQDGRGNVVYDGGFPKFYNGTVPTPTPTTFAAMPAGHKFLYNAVNWVANASKVASGNKKVLILGDKDNSNGGDGYYYLKSTTAVRPDGFKSTFDYIMGLLGYTPTYKTPEDYGLSGDLNPTLSEMEQYSLVILMSSHWLNPGRALITPTAVNDMVTYRENGNGLIFITDHGYILNSIDDVPNSSGAFFKTANAVVSRFGAYFSGDYNRVPVNVGFLRTNYGDHPLYNGMGNGESISAGESESKVVVTITQTYPPASLPTVTTNQTGLNIYNVLALDNAGGFTTGRYVYNIQGSEFIFVDSKDSNGNTQTNAGVWVDNYGRFKVDVRADASTLGTVWGEILHNNQRVGDFYADGSGRKSLLYADPYARAAVGDTIEVKVVSPFGYSKTFTVQGTPIKIGTAMSMSAMASRLRKTGATGVGINYLTKALAAYEANAGVVETGPNFGNGLKKPMGIGATGKYLRHYDVGQYTATTRNKVSAIYANLAAFNTGTSGKPVKMAEIIIVADSGDIYGYKGGSLALITGLRANLHFAYNQYFYNMLDNGSAFWYSKSDGTLTTGIPV